MVLFRDCSAEVGVSRSAKRASLVATTYLGLCQSTERQSHRQRQDVDTAREWARLVSQAMPEHWPCEQVAVNGERTKERKRPEEITLPSVLVQCVALHCQDNGCVRSVHGLLATPPPHVVDALVLGMYWVLACRLHGVVTTVTVVTVVTVVTALWFGHGGTGLALASLRRVTRQGERKRSDCWREDGI